MRPNIAVLSLLCGMPMAALAQFARQEKTINLPARVSVEAASVSRTGKLVAAICSDHVVRVWSVSSSELVRSLEEKIGPPAAVQFSGDGHLLAVAYQIVQYEKGAVRVFNVDSWKVENDLTAPFSMSALAFSPERRRLAFSDVNTEIWDLASGKNLTDISPPFGGSSALSFSPDGRWVATADRDGFVRVYNANTGIRRGTPTEFLLEPFTVAFSPDGKSVLAGGTDKVISSIDPETGKVTRTLPKQSGVVSSLDVSADGKQAAVVYRSAESFLEANHMILWDLVRGIVLADFEKPGIILVAGAFVGGHYLFAAAFGNQLTLWSIR